MKSTAIEMPKLRSPSSRMSSSGWSVRSSRTMKSASATAATQKQTTMSAEAQPWGLVGELPRARA